MSEPLVAINQGQLRGSISTDLDGANYYSFQGIPYAKPPIGKLRFKAPEPAEKWAGILDATKEGNSSYCRDFFTYDIIKNASEDCLILNVFTKKLNLEKNHDTLRPVMFWIHGGGFKWGSSTTDLYSPDFLITEDIVMVSINYRVGMLGFLALEDSTLGVPGNAGLKDMVLALKWVQSNIIHFNGDPRNVTIFGESAGGAAVDLLIMSPMAKGLFHKAISQSGSTLNPWARGKSCSKELAAAIGLETTDEKTLLDKLMEKPVEELFAIQEKLLENITVNEIRPFGFVVENKMVPDAFLTEEPLDIMSLGTINEVPYLIGFNTAEGLIYELFKKPALLQDSTFEINVPWFLGYQPGTVEYKAMAKKIRTFYYGSDQVSESNIENIFAFLTDINFLHGIHATILSRRKNSKVPTYYYRMSVESALNFIKLLVKINIPGASHCDDLGYLFKNFSTPSRIAPGSLEDVTLRRFVRLWTNFAKFGNPTPDRNDPLIEINWPPINENKLYCLDIGKDLTIVVNPNEERTKFWTDIFTNSPALAGTNYDFLKFST